MNKKNLIATVFAAIALLVIIFIFGFNHKNIDKLAEEPSVLENRNSAAADLSDSSAGNSSSGSASDSALQGETSSAPQAPAAEVAAPPLNVLPGSPEAPKQEVVALDEIPVKAIKIQVTAAGFSPKEFKAKSGQSVTLAISSMDGNTHVFIFPRASLMALTTMVAPNETKTITFTAPSAGIYPFRDDISAFRSNTGRMIIE